MTQYFRPLAQTDPIRPTDAIPIAGGWTWFTHAERLTRDGDAEIVAAGDVPTDVLGRISGARGAIAGLSVDQPRLMGIVNVTPDSFSDGGDFSDRQLAVAHGLALAQAGEVHVGRIGCGWESASLVPRERPPGNALGHAGPNPMAGRVVGDRSATVETGTGCQCERLPILALTQNVSPIAPITQAPCRQNPDPKGPGDRHGSEQGCDGQHASSSDNTSPLVGVSDNPANPGESLAGGCSTPLRGHG